MPRRAPVRTTDLDLETLTLHQDGRVLTARFDDPPNQFLSLRLVKDMDRLTRAADEDPTVGAVILTGTGDKFISHSEPEQVQLFFQMETPPLPSRAVAWSIKLNNAAMRVPALLTATEKRGGDWGTGIAYSAILKRTITRMNRSGVVYLAAINGTTLGGGFELALFCDLRIAADADHVRIGLIEILAGLVPGGGGSQRLPAMLGMSAALEHMLEGRPLTAREALDAGVVHRLSAADGLLDDVRATAERLSRRSPYAIAAVKRAVYFGGNKSLSGALDFELAGFIGTGRNPRKHLTADAFQQDYETIGDSPFASPSGTGIDPWLSGTRVEQ